MQARPLIVLMLVSSMLVATTWWLAGSTAIPAVPKPAGAVAGVWSQPLLLCALQMLPLMTETVPGPSPLAIDPAVVERHLTAVYEEAVRAAAALAAANGLLATEEEGEDPD